MPGDDFSTPADAPGPIGSFRRTSAFTQAGSHTSALGTSVDAVREGVDDGIGVSIRDSATRARPPRAGHYHHPLPGSPDARMPS